MTHELTKKLARIEAACRTSAEFATLDKHRDMAKALLAVIDVLKNQCVRCEHCGKPAVLRQPHTEGYFLCLDHAGYDIDPDYYDEVRHPALQSIADSFQETSLP